MTEILKYEIGLLRISDESTQMDPSVIEIDKKVFGYYEHGDEEFGKEIRMALGKHLERQILEQIVKTSTEDGNFKIVFMKYVLKN